MAKKKSPRRKKSLLDKLPRPLWPYITGALALCLAIGLGLYFLPNSNSNSSPRLAPADLTSLQGICQALVNGSVEHDTAREAARKVVPDQSLKALEEDMRRAANIGEQLTQEANVEARREGAPLNNVQIEARRRINWRQSFKRLRIGRRLVHVGLANKIPKRSIDIVLKVIMADFELSRPDPTDEALHQLLLDTEARLQKG